MNEHAGRAMGNMRRALRRSRRPAAPPALLSTPKPSLTYRLISYLLVLLMMLRQVASV